MHKDYGLRLDPIETEKDYVFGGFGSIGGEVLQPDHNWTPFLPQNESQVKVGFDPMDCVSFGTLNALEILARRLYQQDREWSDRFLAKVSGTDHHGNSPQKVAEALRKLGVPNEVDWPYEGSTWQTFYANIPQSVKDLAQTFVAEFEVKHEYVPTSAASLKEALKYSPLGISVCAWYKDNDGYYYQPTGLPDNHWCVLVDYKDQDYWLVFDSADSEPLKKVRWNTLFNTAKRYSLNRQVVNEQSWLQFIIDLTLAIFKAPFQKVIDGPLSVITTPMPPDPKETLHRFCTAIKEHEGWFMPGERANGMVYTRDSRSYRNNNPGNFRCSPVGYLPKYGNVTCINGFAHFEDYAKGWMYLLNSVKHRAENHPHWTIYQFFEHYAPVSDGNDPVAYAKIVAKRCGVSPSVTMQALGFIS